MKKLSTLLAPMAIGIILTASVFAQSPEKMSYQAVVRDGSNNLVTNQSVGMQISILQGSTSGTAVYVETHNPSTNANGLVSLEIGNGTIVTGDFATIDWANGPYFIKTETDPEGGSSYSISGTSQLLSVPYAFHAKSADTVTDGITETDPVYGSSVASGISGTDTTNWNNKLDSYTETDPIYAADSSKITNNISANQQAIQDTASQIRADIPTVPSYSVGDFAQGGIVFWVDETGQHGLVCAKTDQSTGVRWYAGTYGNTQAKGDGPYAGEANTSIIIAAHVAIGDDGNTYAARICNELRVTHGDKTGKTYGDWYLPSKRELNLMYQNKATIDATAGANGGSSFASDYYWSSTEYDNDYAWIQNFLTGSQNGYLKNGTYRVRAVRAF
jgi:hypothetical protein